ncbi:restriction endonuclease subunit S [Streptomyces nigra]
MTFPLVDLQTVLATSAVFTDGDWVESKDQDADGDVRLIQLADVGVGEFLDKSSRFLTSTKAGELRCTFLEVGDVLVARMPDPIGRACIFPGDSRKSVTVVDVCIIRPDVQVVDPRWLMHCLNSPVVHARITQRATGTTRSRISRGNLGKVQVPFPAIAQQRRIAQVLDQVNALRAKRRRAIALLDDLAQSIFFDMFGDVAANSHGWDDSRTLGEVAFISSGITKGRRIPDRPLRSIPYMAVVNVQEMRLNFSVIKEIEATEEEIERYRLMENDLLLTEGGDPDKLGRGTLWRNEIPECIHQNHIFRVRLREGSGIDPVFLNWLVASSRGRRYFLRSAKQTTGIASINATQLKNFPLLVPPIKLQQEFSTRVNQIERYRSSHRQHLAELDALFSSVQHRAFRGELWPDAALPAA